MLSNNCGWETPALEKWSPDMTQSFESPLDRWNISMFHYRNHGAAFGRVLVGMQVPADERKELERFLKELNYEYREETANEAYQLFLA